MMPILHHLAMLAALTWHYFCGHIATVLASTIVPTVIAGLVNRPDANDSKIVALLKLLLRFCGWAKHYDEPGSVKLPLGELLALIWRGLVAVYRVFKPAAPALLIVVIFGTTSGCPLKGTPAGATTAQKLQADLQAIGQIENDVKTQCGPKFGAVATLAGSIVSIAGAVAIANYAGAVEQAFSMIPSIIGSEQAIACVVSVLKTDYEKYKPSASAYRAIVMADPLLARAYAALESGAAYRELVALIDLPPICDPMNDLSTRSCREVTVDDDMPDRCPMTAVRAAARPALVRR